MKNIIRRAAYAVVALASMFSVSCSSDLDEITKPSNGSNNTSTSGITKLNASISQEESMATKAVLGAKGSNGVYPITWEVGDQLAVSNTQTSPSVFSAEFAGGNTEFVLSSGDAPINAKTTGAISAFYPAGMVTGFIDGKYVVNLPEVQRYTEGSFDKEAYLMGAYTTVSESAPNPNLEFKSLCSVLDLRVTSSYDTRVKRIVISSTSPLTGKGEVTLKADTKELTMASDANTSVILDCGETGVQVTAGTPKNFYVVVPSQDYENLRINVETTDGKFQIFNNTTKITLAKAKLAPVSLVYNNAKKIPVLTAGSIVNGRMKDAAYSKDNIKKVVFEVNSLRKSNKTVHSAANSPTEIYVSYDSGTIIISTLAPFIKVRKDSFGDLATGIFHGYKYLKTIEGLENLDTSDVESMKYMFWGCNRLESLDLSCFKTSNVTDMYWMFSGCSHLKSLKLDNFDTSNVTNMSGLFSNCKSLTSLDLRDFDTSNVTDMSLMFNECENLSSLNLNGLNMSKVTTMQNMFSGCKSLTSLDLNFVNTSGLVYASEMFSGCSSLISLDLRDFNTSNAKSLRDMFYGCSSLVSLDLSNFDTSKVTDMSGMFINCSSLTTLNLSNFITSNVTTMESMFSGCSNLASLDLSQFVISSNFKNANWMFLGAKDNVEIRCTKDVEDYLKTNKLSPSKATFTRP